MANPLYRLRLRAIKAALHLPEPIKKILRVLARRPPKAVQAPSPEQVDYIRQECDLARGAQTLLNRASVDSFFTTAGPWAVSNLLTLAMVHRYSRLSPGKSGGQTASAIQGDWQNAAK